MDGKGVEGGEGEMSEGEGAGGGAGGVANEIKRDGEKHESRGEGNDEQRKKG